MAAAVAAVTSSIFTMCYPSRSLRARRLESAMRIVPRARWDELSSAPLQSRRVSARHYSAAMKMRARSLPACRAAGRASTAVSTMGGAEILDPATQTWMRSLRQCHSFRDRLLPFAPYGVSLRPYDRSRPGRPARP